MNKNVILLFYPLVDKDKQIPNLPFSVLNLERMLRDLGLEIIIIDERVIVDYKQIILENKDRLLMAGVSAMIGYQMISGKEFSLFFKQHSDAPLVWGGWFANVLPELALKENFIDFIIHGQGEIPFKNFVETFIRGEDFKNIRGLGYKIDNKIVINPLENIVDEKSFPNINFNLVDVNKIANINEPDNTGASSLNYIATIGCPYSCAFCCLASIWGQKTFNKDVSLIIDDLKLLKNKYRVNKVAFDDDHFFGKRSFVIELCTKIIEENLDIKWEANAHISNFLKSYSDEDIELISQSGCVAIRFGAESGSQEVLDRVNKKVKVEETYQIAKLMRKHNVRCVLYIVVSFPWNPSEDFKLTLNMVSLAKIINPGIEVGINFFVPLPNTPLYEEGIKYGFEKFTSFDQLIKFIKTEYTAPWWTRNYRKELHHFIWFYFKYANPQHYKQKPKEIRVLSFLVNKFFYPICYLRLKFNFRKLRFDAYLYFCLKKLFNFITSNKYADDSEAMARSRSWRR